MDWARYGAVLFDLDGVLTPTASLHAAAWKRTFDALLEQRYGSAPDRFDLSSDYRLYVDGKPRYDGADSFLRSRGVELPRGDSSDPPGYETVCAVGNLKNESIIEILESEGIEAFPGSIRLLEYLAELNMPMAVVTASANGKAILDAAGLSHHFVARVDGVVAAELDLRGKPHPDPFLEAARRLGVKPASAVVVEDAISGVAAGRAGGFGLVIGVDRHDDPDALYDNGADVVVSDLAELVP